VDLHACKRSPANPIRFTLAFPKAFFHFLPVPPRTFTGGTHAAIHHVAVYEVAIMHRLDGFRSSGMGSLLNNLPTVQYNDAGLSSRYCLDRADVPMIINGAATHYCLHFLLNQFRVCIHNQAPLVLHSKMQNSRFPILSCALRYGTCAWPAVPPDKDASVFRLRPFMSCPFWKLQDE